MKKTGANTMNRHETRPPSLGTSALDILRAWKSLPLGFCGYRGTLLPAALNIHNGLEYFCSGLTEKQVYITTGPAMCRIATTQELDDFLEAALDGAVEIYMRGTYDSYADRRLPHICLHQATAQSIQLGE